MLLIKIMKTNMIVIVALVIGIIISGLTGLINTTPVIIGATWYGWPVAWMYNYVTYPPSTAFNYVNLVVDIVIWTVVAFVILWIAMRGKKK
jgi:hypothetical protein